MDQRLGDCRSTPGSRVACIEDDDTRSIPASTTATKSSSVDGPVLVLASSSLPPSRYESQKRRDWNTFSQYLKKQYDPPLSPSQCSAAHVVEFLGYMDRFGKTRIHTPLCPLFGLPDGIRITRPPLAAAARCPCPLRQAWGSLDALIGRLRAAFEENGGKHEGNPFGAPAVRLYLREVCEFQAKARGISYKKQRKPKPHISKSKATTSSTAPASPTSLS